MARTINAYISDSGELVVTISAGNVTAVAGFTTAEAITLDGALRAVRWANIPRRTSVSMKVTGDADPIVLRTNTKEGEYQFEIDVVDDYSEGAAGEWGTDLLSAYEIFLLLDANDEDPGGIKFTPAGGATGDIEWTLTSPQLEGVSLPEIDADADNAQVLTAFLSCSGYTYAAHS